MPKTLYHSRLVGDPVTFTVKSGPHESKYPGKPDYFVLIHDGEEKYYPLENPSHANKLKPFVGQTIKAQFTGRGKDDAKDIVITGMAGDYRQPNLPPDPEDVPPGAEPPRRPAMPPSSPQAAPQTGVGTVYHTGIQIANTWLISYRIVKEVNDVLKEDYGEPMDDQLIINLLTRLSIKLDNLNSHTQLPTKLIRPKK